MAILSVIVCDDLMQLFISTIHHNNARPYVVQNARYGLRLQRVCVAAMAMMVRLCRDECLSPCNETWSDVMVSTPVWFSMVETEVTYLKWVSSI